jgi:hypothetical protein
MNTAMGSGDAVTAITLIPEWMAMTTGDVNL